MARRPRQPATDRARSPDDGDRLMVSVRLPRSLVNGLRLAATKRQIDRTPPDSVQGIVEQAVTAWMRMHKYL